MTKRKIGLDIYREEKLHRDEMILRLLKYDVPPDKIAEVYSLLPVTVKKMRERFINKGQLKPHPLEYQPQDYGKNKWVSYFRKHGKGKIHDAPPSAINPQVVSRHGVSYTVL
jgi:hypothetical protein